MKSISPKEKAVLDLIRQGLSSKQIAESLNVSFHTVQTHRKNLMRKFKARNSVDLVYRIIQSDIQKLFTFPLHDINTKQPPV
jgi:DNA-binding NarL/FixJ family response regulator